MSCPIAVWARAKGLFSPAITTVTISYSRKLTSIACDDDDCCGLVENPSQRSPACNFFERCGVKFFADRWITRPCRQVTIIRCTFLNSLSAPFPRVLHSFSLHASHNKLSHAPSNLVRLFSVFQRKSTVFTFYFTPPHGEPRSFRTCPQF